MRAFLTCLLLLGSLSASAQVYTYIDAEGNRVFTDQPRGGNAKPVQMAPINGMTPTIKLKPEVEQNQPVVLSYQMLRILVPQPDATIRDNAGNLIVSATSEPELLPGHSFRLILDGETVGETGRSPVFPLENIDRGTHQLAVEIIDQNERIIERTPSQPFHLLRTSLAQKRQVNPCKIKDFGVRPECPLKDKPEEETDIPFVPFM
ncbi:DUF4124 domain-containing protein [Pseudomonas sp. EL_65y_Pfl2_R95]|uniref:DUF4124 domain-containing protein n=1 Tax=Pseudomonas sp. EL_65y_Pfl2_R95 TaxID=3088698 RepID=UPI0030DAD9DC